MVYKFKVTIPISKVFMREIAVSSDMNLFRFNRFLLSELGFGTDQLVKYKAYDAKGRCTAQYALFDLGDGALDKVTFADVVARGQGRIEIVYDLRSMRIINLAYEGEMPSDAKINPPAIIAEKGHNPGQFADKYEDYMYENPVRGLSGLMPTPDDSDRDDDEDDDELEELYDGELEESDDV